MFQFRRFPTYAYLIQRRLMEYCSIGFPHSEISGSKRMCRSPKLIAACHVLHRLLMPRHSPCALISLTSPAWIPPCLVQTNILVLSRIMQRSQKFHFGSIVFTLFRVSTIFAYFALCCLLLHTFIYVVQFSRCRPSNLLQGQIEMFELSLNHFDPIL